MLFRNITILDENFEIVENAYVGIKDQRIDYIGQEEPAEDYGQVYDGKGKLLMPGFFNSHAHAPMTLLRGYAENMNLQDWLFTRVFPFEDQLSGESVYWGTLLSMAESLRFGIVSTSDMYFFVNDMAEAYLKAGVKGNLSRCISHFDDSDFITSFRAEEMIDLYEKYHKAGDGKILVDMSLHSEYTTTPIAVKQLAEYTKKIGAHMQVHVSETKKEHEECKERHGMTPVEYLNSHGLFDTPTTAAHCVWLEDGDYKILKEKGVTVACNPVSNLKLASGVCNVDRLLKEGINVTIGTDGVSSNNSLNMMEEMKIFTIAPKMIYNNPESITPEDALRAATVNGAIAQGRMDCGLLKEGYKADLIVVDISGPHMNPVHNLKNNLVYSASGSDVIMTMVDGKVLYEDGKYTTIDIEEVIREADRVTKEILAKI